MGIGDIAYRHSTQDHAPRVVLLGLLHIGIQFQLPTNANGWKSVTLSLYYALCFVGSYAPHAQLNNYPAHTHSRNAMPLPLHCPPPHPYPTANGWKPVVKLRRVTCTPCAIRPEACT